MTQIYFMCSYFLFKVLVNSYPLFFQLVTTYYPGKSQYASALKVYNQAKNRSPDFLACDTSRVYLEPSADVEGEDYINASWIGGEEFIL